MDNRRRRDPLIEATIAALEALPPAERNAVIFMATVWIETPREVRAVFARFLKDRLTKQEVARLAGVDRRTLSRWETYRRGEEVVGSPEFRPPTKRRANRNGGWDAL